MKRNFKSGISRNTIIIGLIVILVIALIITTLLYLSKNNNSGEKEDERELNDEKSNIVATYDGGEVTQEEVIVYYYLVTLGNPELKQEKENLGYAIINYIVKYKLLNNVALENGINVVEGQEEKLNEMFSDKEAIADKLKKEFDINENVNLDIDIFKEAYVRQANVQKYLKSIEDSGEVFEGTIEAIFASININDEKLQTLIDELLK